MLLRVNVEKPADFAAWLDREQAAAVTTVAGAPATDPAIERGRVTFQALSCVNCHAVRGTPAVGTFGPDLTHLKSRETLASGLIPNDREHLRAWLVDPQAIKPGCLMPSFRLNDAQLDDVVVYLETLR
jgi:cytochrome c oxidase subunit 2